MKIDDLLKRRLLFFFISFIFIVIVTLSSSYAILNNNVNKSKVINNGNLEITYENGLDVNNYGYPLSYEEGDSKSPSNIIKIKNLSTSVVAFNLNILVNDVNNSLDPNKIYYMINESNPKILGENLDSKIFSESIAPKGVYILDIKVWAGLELINNNDQGREIDLKFEVVEAN